MKATVAGIASTLNVEKMIAYGLIRYLEAIRVVTVCGSTPPKSKNGQERVSKIYNFPDTYTIIFEITK